MAGIYIPNMELPTKCPCRLIGSGYDVYCYAVYGIPARFKEYDECCENETRASWCPLVAVPDHGRLIDADVATKLCKTDAGIYDLTDTPEFLSYLPTIIPADKEKN